jgi:rubrerythrin
MEKIRSIQDILDYAIEKESEASSFYKHLAEHISEPETREAVEKFSADEFQHKLHLEGVRDGQVELTPEEVGSLHIAEGLDAVKPRDEMSYKELLAFAIKQEDAAHKLYSKLAQVTKRDKIREMFTLLAQEEARHKLNLEFEYDLATF